MTSVTSANNAALLILQQVNSSSSASKDSDTKSAADQITALVNGVSGETSAVKTQASSTINGALLDMKEKQDSTVQAALDFIDSDKFQTSDPTLKDTLKKLISENGEEFAKKVQAQQAKHSGISLENAIVNAVTETIVDNREQFSSGEIVLGTKMSSGSAGLTNIPALDGSSEYGSLIDARKAERAAFSAQIRSGETEFKPDDGSHKAAMQDWANKWFNEFGWETPADLR